MPFKRAVWLQLLGLSYPAQAAQVSMPFKRAVWLQRGADPVVSSGRQLFQCPLSGQFGCNRMLMSFLPPGVVSMPFKRAVWLQLTFSSTLARECWFQCPLSGQFGCNRRLCPRRSRFWRFQSPFYWYGGCRDLHYSPPRRCSGLNAL